MSSMTEEPTSDDAVRAWIAEHMRAHDPFTSVIERSERHRAEHGCDVYPSDSGNLLGTLAALAQAEHILEVGCGLGYSALWLAYGAGPSGLVETIEQDATHAALARDIIRDQGYEGRISVLEGPLATILPTLAGPYDLIFYDAFIPTPDDLTQFARLLRAGGMLITSNLFLGRYGPDEPDLIHGAAYRRSILEDGDWLTAFAGMKAVSVRR